MNPLKGIKHLALDLDGTLYLGGKVFDCTLPFLRRIAAMGIGRTFFTNNSSKSTRQYVENLNRMGIEVSEPDLYSSTHATLDYLREEMPAAKRLFVMGTAALRGEFEENGFKLCGDDAGDEPDAVVVGFDPTMTYEKVCRAAYWISKGKKFLATNPDRICPTDQPTVLVDCGSMCRMITHATGVEPHAVLGKPNKRMLQGVMNRHNLRANELAVVGDRIYTDMAMARAAGALGVLVLTGETTRQQAIEAATDIELLVADVGELARLLSDALEKTG